MKKMFFVTVTIVALFVFFSVPCFSQTILGCYHNKNGKLRIVSDHSLCKKAELPITWNSGGTQGPPGERGPQGLQGDQGIQGIQGIPGSKGDKGDAGSQGPAGSIAVFSATDQYLGILNVIDGNGVYLFFPSVKAFMSINGDTGHNPFTGITLNSVRYSEPGCTGNAYAVTEQYGNMRSVVFSVNTGVGQAKHYVISGQRQSVTSYSSRQYTDDFPCQEMPTGETAMRTPLTEVIVPFTYPVAVPLSFE